MHERRFHYVFASLYDKPRFKYFNERTLTSIRQDKSAAKKRCILGNIFCRDYFPDILDW